jgi:hypothetical protein
MFKVISMFNTSYFPAGKLFLKTRDRINADFVVYSPDLTSEQSGILKDHNISIEKLDPKEFETKMQFLKFYVLRNEITKDIDNKYEGFTFVDFDTFFVNDWNHIFKKYDFNFGVTARSDMIKTKTLRAYANGGVIFTKRSGLDIIKFAEKLILKGKSKILPEYDRIWKTLENGRPAHKTHYRTNLRWWNDQIFFSSLILKYFSNVKSTKLNKIDPIIFEFNRFKIGIFNCNFYNVLDSNPKITNEKNKYIKHLKAGGREILGVKKIKEKL